MIRMNQRRLPSLRLSTGRQNAPLPHAPRPIAARTVLATAVLIALLGACSDPVELDHPTSPLAEPETLPGSPDPLASTSQSQLLLEEFESLDSDSSVSSSGTAAKLMLTQQRMQLADVASEASFIRSRPAIAAEPAIQLQENREQYASIDPSSVKRVADEPVSTFSIDVDTGSYANVRRHLEHGSLPPSDAVRIEEMINYFGYDYAQPVSGDAPFSVATTMAPTPWNQSSELLRIAIKGVDVDATEARSANLVFLVDVSGSMSSPDKLGLLKSSLLLLARGLDADDRVSIVTYAGAVGTVLDGAAGDDIEAIDDALSRLAAGGSTAGGAGIEAAYRLAKEHATETSVNRVILATDGDFNVGISDTDSLIELIERRREQGTALTTLGFGAGNYNDELMERLADAGNGNHAYIDTLGEARKVLSQQLDGTLFTIAKDVKIQIEFNPETVSEYRLIGYENRALADEDFANDKVDAGDIGSGHTVTALYEIVRAGQSGWLSKRRYDAVNATNARNDELGELRLRYKKPNGATSERMVETIASDASLPRIEDADGDFRFATAVAAFGERLRDDRYLGDFDYGEVLALARGARGDDPFGYRAGFIELVELARVLDDSSAVSKRDGQNVGPDGLDDLGGDDPRG